MSEFQFELFTEEDITNLPLIQPADWPDITPTFLHYLHSSFCFPYKLIADNTFAGTGTVIIHNDVAWLAHIIVHLDHRKKGLGNFITQSLLSSLQDKNCSTVYLIATDLGLPVYLKQGFLEDTEYVAYKKTAELPQFSTNENITGFTEIYKEQIKRLDRKISGEDRFFILEEHLQKARIYQNNNTVEGFYLPTLGEGLIIAENSIAGIALMKERLSTHENAILPVDNKEGIKFLEDLHLTRVRVMKRMYTGEKRKWFPQHLYNRIGGNVG